MAVSTGTSAVLSSCLFMLLFAAMQIYKAHLASSQPMTILGGFLGSVLFMLILTAVSNTETHFFGKNFQTKLIPEVLICLVIAMVASGMVHRVCVTTCLIFSLVALYYISRISIKVHGTGVAPVTANSFPKGKKAK
ncbi:protein KRTCAP2 homolog [Amblyomma americanum]|uniref:Putative conserved membrane protein n=2 Tax=Amblyomma TaxID=6942 RepID=A0A023FUF3_AMBPA